MESKSIWYLENIDATSIFCPSKLGDGQHMKNHKVVKKNEYIYLPDDQADKVYMINEGRIKISADSAEGKEVTKAILTKGEIFGELSVIGQTKRKNTAQAIEKTTLCVLDVNQMKGLMREHNAFSMFMMKIIGRRVLEMEGRLESLVFKDSRTRIIEFLQSLGVEKGEQVGFEVVVRKFLTHQQIANLTATSRQTVTTILNELRNSNIITFDRRRLLIRDMNRLADAATEPAA